MAFAIDDFNRVDAPTLGANWTVPTGADSYSLNTNEAFPGNTLATENAEYYNPLTPGPAQYAKATLGSQVETNNATGHGPAVRMATGARTYIQVMCNTTKLVLAEMVGGIRTSLGTGFTHTSVTGDVIELDIDAAHFITVKLNGTTVITYDNSATTLTTGRVGIAGEIFNLFGAVDSWEGGDLNVVTPLVGYVGSKRLPGMRGPRDKQGFIKRGVYDYTIPVATALNIAGDVGSIVLTGFAPSIGFGITGAQGSVVLAGFAPSIGFGLTGNTGSIVLAGFVPNIGFGLTGNTGSITLSGFAPSIGFGLTGNTGSITLSGFAPSIGFGLTGNTGLITLAGFAPNIGFGLIGNTGSVVLTGFAPTLSQAFNLAANVGSIVLTGFVPAIGLSGGTTLDITGATGSLLLTGFAPNIAFGLQGAVGSIVLTGFAPTLAQTFALTAGTGSLVLDGFAPTLDGVLFTPPVGGSGGKEIRGGLLYWLRLLKELETQGTPEPQDAQEHEQFIAKRERLRAKVQQAQRAEAARKAAEIAMEQEDEERILMLFLQYLSGNYGSN